MPPSTGIPYIDRIAYRIDMRERAMAIAPQSAITKDNVSVDVAGILYIQVQREGFEGPPFVQVHGER